MASIAFNDGAAAVLTNGMPISRFSNWTPLTRPVGDTANRESDGLGMMFRTRTDYAASFEFRNIPVKETRDGAPNSLIAPTDFTDSAWVKTNLTTTPNDAAGPDGVVDATKLQVTSTGAETTLKQTVTLTSRMLRYEVDVFGSNLTIGRYVIFDATNNVGVVGGELTHSTGVWNPIETSGTATVTRLSADPYWRLRLETPNGGIGNSYSVILGWFGTTTVTAGQYMHITEARLFQGQRNVEIADRLIAHLLGGGTCSVNTADHDIDGAGVDGTVYDTCGLAPGTTPNLTLADPVTLEYTLSLALINLDASPSQMVCRYA